MDIKYHSEGSRVIFKDFIHDNSVCWNMMTVICAFQYCRSQHPTLHSSAVAEIPRDGGEVEGQYVSCVCNVTALFVVVKMHQA